LPEGSMTAKLHIRQLEGVFAPQLHEQFVNGQAFFPQIVFQDLAVLDEHPRLPVHEVAECFAFELKKFDDEGHRDPDRHGDETEIPVVRGIQGNESGEGSDGDPGDILEHGKFGHLTLAQQSGEKKHGCHRRQGAQHDFQPLRHGHPPPAFRCADK